MPYNMGDRDRTLYYDDRGLERGDYNRRNSHDSRSRPRFDNSPAREYHYTRTSDKDIVRYNDDKFDDDRALERRYRSSSSSPAYRGYADHHHTHRDRDYDYDDDYNRDRDHHHHHHSHSTSHDRHKSGDHHEWKNAAATLLGGIAGASAARKASHESRLGTVAGVVVGAWGGHELEKGWEHHEAKEKRRRNSERR